jgi:hypothetical protein
VARGANVQLADDGELRGKVVRVRDRELVVRFDTLADHRRIPAQGGLNVLPSDVVYNAQLRTIESIREGRTANPRLLEHLVDGRLARYRPDARAQPRNGLDAAQLRVFRRALSVPDLLLVWGPPGTGKTTTITEIVAAHAERGERVLLTSHANRAVDNVLERLPEHLRSVRIGNEDAMTTRARALMVDALVAGLREQILGATADAAAGLGSLQEQGEALRRGLEYLGARLADARTADGEAGARAAALQAIVRRLTAPIRSEIAAAESRLSRARSRLERLERDLPAARLRLDRAAGRAASGLPAFLWRWLAAWAKRRIQRIESALPAARTELAGAESGHVAIQERVRALMAGDPEATQQERSQQAAAARREEALRDAVLVVDGVVGGLRAAGLTPPTWPDRIAEWAPFQEWLAWALSTAARRAALLLEWRSRVEEAEEDLQRELIRYADVVAATCIGSATSKALQEVEFDLVIVDEAGQVGLPTLLVPLVKARRAILVGDHKQLPPFLDEDVKQWSERVDGTSDTTPETAKWIADVVRKSAFEQLHGFADDDHRDVLSVQRRMPEVIADFVSKEFYGGLLQTEHREGAADPLFRSRFALVDTSDRPPDERREQQFGTLEESGQRGYINDLEARLIASLVVQYVRWYEDWAVIVPYRAQAERIRKLLTGALGSEHSIPESVNTVDSFQGGERELVVYGFTRSNDRGAVGFLRELRRINVAITRARRQLVLVGDTRTLLAARDDGFAGLMRSMAAHVAARGDACSSRDVERRLVDLAEQRP